MGALSHITPPPSKSGSIDDIGFEVTIENPRTVDFLVVSHGEKCYKTCLKLVLIAFTN